MDLKNKVIEIVFECTGKKIIDDINLVDAGIIDSFGIMNILISIEETFDIEVSVEDIIRKNFEKIDTIVEMIEKYVQGD